MGKILTFPISLFTKTTGCTAKWTLTWMKYGGEEERKGLRMGGGDYEGKGEREGKFCNQKKLRIAVNSTLKVSIHN